MVILFKRFLLTVTLLALTVPLSSNAAQDQFYFLARQAAAGSITLEGQAQQVVYLRWDTVEGKLPADVVSFRLLRNGTPLTSYDLPANAVMPATEINKLYLGTAQQRRKREMITRLNEMAASNGDTFSVSTFASYLHDLLNAEKVGTYNPLWAFLGSRTDFNIARARYRGWIDDTPGSGIVEYELLAVNASGDTARLGFVQVDLALPNTLLGASNFRQLRNSDSRCDLPEAGKDHFTVALNWNSPGETPANPNISDRIATQLYISGYDLYRGSENLAVGMSVAPQRDIAALAAVSASDSRGNPLISGLEKVNLSIVVDPGQSTAEPKWLEARDLLTRAGLKPGDRRAYYLVARDFTGNYGPTLSTIVEVPLMTRPPAPWNIRSFADENSAALGRGVPDALTLSWDKVNLDNYLRMFQDTRRYCNLLEAQQSGVLEFVGIDQSCDNDVLSSVRLDVVDYRIYRFTDFDVAGRFKDSDGDGFSDADEHAAGSQCDVTSFPSLTEAHNYLAPASDIQLLTEESLPLPDREIIRLRDRAPAGSKDTVYWYRIASVAGSADENGRLSFLSAPQRGLFPNRNPPFEPQVTTEKPGKVPVGCELQSDSTASSWRFSEGLTPPGGKEAAFTMRCDGLPAKVSNKSLITASSFCRAITESCNKAAVVEISFADSAQGTPLNDSCKNIVLPSDISLCNSGSIEIVPTYADGMLPTLPGDLVATGGVSVEVCPTQENTCVTLYESIDGTASRVANQCDGSCISYQPGEGPFCGYAVASDENNNISNAVHIPCTIAPSLSKTPTPPQIVSFSVDDTLARFSYRLPAQQTAVIMTQLEHEPGDGDRSRTNKGFPAISAQPGQIISQTLPVSALQASQDRFCLSLKAVSRSVGKSPSITSPWSKQRCVTRVGSSEEELPQYMPWPTVEAPRQGGKIVGGLLTTFRQVPDFLVMRLVKQGGLLDGCERILPGQIPGNTAPPSTPPEQTNQFDNLECTDAGKAAVTAALAPYMNFILYRQSRIVGGDAGNWIQVSPLIEFAHFDDIPTRAVEKGSKFIEWRLNDPFVKFLFAGDGQNNDDLIFIFLDRYPFISVADLAATQLYEYRYQLVHFDDRHKPVRWRQSDWFRETE